MTQLSSFFGTNNNSPGLDCERLLFYHEIFHLIIIFYFIRVTQRLNAQMTRAYFCQILRVGGKTHREETKSAG